MSASGHGQPQDAEGELVQFVGGPWDGESSRSCVLVDLSNMAAPGGHYLFGGLDDDGEVVYVYEGAQAARRHWPDGV